MTPHCTYTEHELRAAHRVLPFGLLGIGLEQAMRNPAYRAVIEAKAASNRQILRDLARRAEQMRAGRWLAATSPLDAYEQTERDVWVSGVAA